MMRCFLASRAGHEKKSAQLAGCSRTDSSLVRSGSDVAMLTCGRMPTQRLRSDSRCSRWVINENTHEPIIDRELFARRKQLAGQRTFNLRSSPRRAVKYLLARMIRCDHCGGVYVGRRQKKRGKKNGEHYDLFRYRCNSYVTKGRSVCPSLGIHCEWIEGEIVELVRREICSPERLAALQELVRTKIEARRSRYGRHPREFDRRIADIDRRIENYYRAIGDGLDTTTCREHIARLEIEKEEVQEEAELLRQDDYYRRALQLNLTELDRFAAAFKDDFRTLPMATQRRVLLHFIEEIRVVDHEVVRVQVKVPFDDNGVRHLTDEILTREGTAAVVAATQEQDLLDPTRGLLDRPAPRCRESAVGTSRGSHLMWIIAALGALTLVGVFIRMEHGFGPFNLRAVGILLVASLAALVALAVEGSLNPVMGSSVPSLATSSG